MIGTLHARAMSADAALNEAPFEILDYSVATPLELLVQRIEEVVRAWVSAASRTRSEHEIAHENHKYILSLHGDPADAAGDFRSDLMDASLDFASDAFADSCATRLPRWFGLRTFVLISPAADVESLESNAMAMAQSALNVALSNCCCRLPCFVLHERASMDVYGRVLAGMRDGQQLGYRFDVRCQDSVPEALLTPRGLCELVRSRLLLLSPPAGTAVTVAWRQTYALHEWPVWRQLLTSAPAGLTLDLGSRHDPLPSLLLSAQWPCAPLDDQHGLPERGLGSAGGAPHPDTAPLWLLRAMPEARPHLLFGSRHPSAPGALARSATLLVEGLAACTAAAERDGTHGGGDGGGGGGGGAAADRVLSSMATAGTRLLSTDERHSWLDAVVRTVPSAATAGAESAALFPAAALEGSEELRGVAAAVSRGARAGSLLHRLGLAALRATRATRRGAQPACALLQLWRDLLEHVRRCVEHGEPLPHVEAREPERGRVSAVQQELQLIALCVHTMRVKTAAEAPPRAAGADEGGEAGEGGGPAAHGARVPLRDETGTPLVGLESGAALWVPATQKEAPATDAMLAMPVSDAMHMERLKSDMQAFKAANPGGVLADFLRWRPLADAVAGWPTERRQDPTHIATELWALAAPLTASQQRPLFNAERVYMRMHMHMLL